MELVTDNILYQICNLGTPEIEHIADLRITDNRISFVQTEGVNPKLPCIYLYWGMSESDKQNQSGIDLNKLVYDGMVLPIVPDANKFNDYIPDELRKINAFHWDAKKTELLANRILKFFGLLECTSKVFISYRRSDTTAFAHQLYEELCKSKFVPFLDCYCIESGVPFQEYLRNEVVDSDVFIYLNSPNYEDSEYTKEERDCAQKLSIGVVQVVFNNAAATQLLNSVVIATGEDADKDNTYSQELLERVVKEVNTQRAVMYEFRRKSMINSYRMINDGDTIVLRDSGVIFNVTKHELLNPVVHVPNSVDFQKTDKMLNWASPDIYKRCLLYDSQFVRRDILDHINWLNTSLPIKSFDINA